MAEPACSVPTPPGCPVPHASKRSSASAPRTSPIGMTSAGSALTSVVLPVEVSPATRMFLRAATRDAQQLGPASGHDAGRDAIAEREHRDGRAANSEARSHHHQRHQPLEPLPAFRQFGRNTRRSGVDLDAERNRAMAVKRQSQSCRSI